MINTSQGERFLPSEFRSAIENGKDETVSRRDQCGRHGRRGDSGALFRIDPEGR